MRWDGQKNSPVSGQKQTHDAQKPVIVGQMLQNIEQAEEVKGISKRRAIDVRLHESGGPSASALVQPLEVKIQPDDDSSPTDVLKNGKDMAGPALNLQNPEARRPLGDDAPDEGRQDPIAAAIPEVPVLDGREAIVVRRT